MREGPGRVRWGAWFGGVGGHGESGFGDHVQAFVGEGEVADDVVVEVFYAGAVQPDVVGAPATAEFLAVRGQFADEIVEFLVVGSRPASVRTMATQVSAARSRSG